MHIFIILLGLNTSLFLPRDWQASVWIQPLQRPEMTEHLRRDDANPPRRPQMMLTSEKLHKTSKFCYKFDRNI